MSSDDGTGLAIPAFVENFEQLLKDRAEHGGGEEHVGCNSLVSCGLGPGGSWLDVLSENVAADARKNNWDIFGALAAVVKAEAVNAVGRDWLHEVDVCPRIVPMIAFLYGGGPVSILNCMKFVRNHTPIVVVKGSGRAAVTTPAPPRDCKDSYDSCTRCAARFVFWMDC